MSADKIVNELRDVAFLLKWDGGRYTVNASCIDTQEVVPLAAALDAIAAVREDEKARCVAAVDKLEGQIDPLGYSTIRWLEAVEAIRNA